MSKSNVEHRMVCAKHGQRGHSSHAYIKKNLAKAQQDTIDANHRASQGSTFFYKEEAPYVIQRREVGAWEDIEAAIAREKAVIEGE